MDDDASESPGTVAQTALKQPEKAPEAIDTLFDYVDVGGEDVSDAASALSLLARRNPVGFDGQTDRFESALKTADDGNARRKLVSAVNTLLDQDAIPLHDAGPALTEATRIRDEKYWEIELNPELLNIREGLIGWTDVAAMGVPVPDKVVVRSIKITDIAKPGTIVDIIGLLQAAIASDSPKRDTAFEGIAMLAEADDETLTSSATIATAELVLNDDIPDEETAREIITANADTVRRKKQLVEQAREVITP